MIKISQIFLALTLVCVSHALFAQTRYVAVPLPFLPNGINNQGDVVGYGGNGGNYTAYRWSNGLVTSLGAGIAYGINDTGDIVGTANNHAALWKADGQFIDIGSGEYAGGAARAINNNGQIVGDFGANNELGIYSYSATSFIYHNGVTTLFIANLGTATRSNAFAVDNLGHLSGAEQVSYAPGVNYAYDTGNGFGSLVDSIAYGMNDNGISVGITAKNQLQLGFIRSGTTSTQIGVNPTIALDVNNQNQVVGASNNHAFIYENNTLVDLNDITDFGNSGVATLIRAVAINEAGWIVGTDANGAGFLLKNAAKLTVTSAANGVVTSDSGEMNCGTACENQYVIGSQVTLTATPNAGFLFLGWQGACSGTALTCAITMDGDKTATPRFGRPALTVTTTGTGTGRIASTPAGIDCTPVCSAEFDANTVINLTAFPDLHSKFTGWNGLGCTGTGVCAVTLDAAKSVAAAFTIDTFALKINKQGDGTIVSNVAGINCGSSCKAQYGFGTVVTLTPIPNNSGTVFLGWGGACSGQGLCTVAINAATTVSAKFGSGFGLTVNPPSHGLIKGGKINCGSDGVTAYTPCNANYLAGTALTLSARPVPGFSFAGWNGDCAGTTLTCVVTMDAAKTVSANFLADKKLSVSKTGNGTVTGSKINCGSICEATYKHGTAVTLTARPVAKAKFIGWSGACTGTVKTCTVTLDEAKSVTAEFTP